MLIGSAFIWVLLVRDHGVDILNERIASGGQQACINRAEAFMADYKNSNPSARLQYLCQMVKQ